MVTRVREGRVSRWSATTYPKGQGPASLNFWDPILTYGPLKLYNNTAYTYIHTYRLYNMTNSNQILYGNRTIDEKTFSRSTNSPPVPGQNILRHECCSDARLFAVANLVVNSHDDVSWHIHGHIWQGAICLCVCVWVCVCALNCLFASPTARCCPDLSPVLVRYSHRANRNWQTSKCTLGLSFVTSAVSQVACLINSLLQCVQEKEAYLYVLQ